MDTVTKVIQEIRKYEDYLRIIRVVRDDWSAVVKIIHDLRNIIYQKFVNKKVCLYAFCYVIFDDFNTEFIEYFIKSATTDPKFLPIYTYNTSNVSRFRQYVVSGINTYKRAIDMGLPSFIIEPFAIYAKEFVEMYKYYPSNLIIEHGIKNCLYGNLEEVDIAVIHEMLAKSPDNASIKALLRVYDQRHQKLGKRIQKDYTPSVPDQKIPRLPDYRTDEYVPKIELNREELIKKLMELINRNSS